MCINKMYDFLSHKRLLTKTESVDTIELRQRDKPLKIKSIVIQ